MPILLVSLAFTFLGSTLWTQSLFRTAFQFEREQIGIDNAGIYLGRGDRTIFRRFQRESERLRLWEVMHHEIHLCARVPSPQAKVCLMKDQALERQLRMAREIFYEWAKWEWKASKQRAQGEARRLGSVSFGTSRPEDLPVRGVRCQVCNQEVGWELSDALNSYRVYSSGHFERPIETMVEIVNGNLSGKTPCEYRLKLPKE
jgi:hypothetical protein